MQEGFTFADIILLIALAAFIFTRFTSFKLPKESDEEKKKRKQATKENGGKVLDFPVEASAKEEKTVNMAKQKTSVSPKALKDLKGVEQIKAVDPEFNEKEFVSGATAAYEMYYEAVSEADDEMLETLLTPRLYDETLQKIEDTEAQGKGWKVDVASIEDAKIIDARLHGRTAVVEVKYTASQADYIEDAKGKISEGSKDAKQVSSVWTWARPIDSEDLNWELEKIDPVS